MGLYERLTGEEEPRIAVHQLMAALAEAKRGRVNRAQVAAAFSLSPVEMAELQILAGRFDDITTPLTGVELHDILLLAEKRLFYGTATGLKTRLGV